MRVNSNILIKIIISKVQILKKLRALNLVKYNWGNNKIICGVNCEVLLDSADLTKFRENCLVCICKWNWNVCMLFHGETSLTGLMLCKSWKQVCQFTENKSTSEIRFQKKHSISGSHLQIKITVLKTTQLSLSLVSAALKNGSVPVFRSSRTEGAQWRSKA